MVVPTLFLLVFACTSLVKLNTVLEASKWYTRELNWQNTRKDIGDLGNRQEAIQISSKSTSFVKCRITVIVERDGTENVSFYITFEIFLCEAKE